MKKIDVTRLSDILSFKHLFEKMYGPEDTLSDEKQLFAQKNSLVIVISSFIMLICNILWLVLNALNNNNRGLDYPLSRYGLIVHIAICFFTILVISFFPQLKKN